MAGYINKNNGVLKVRWVQWANFVVLCYVFLWPTACQEIVYISAYNYQRYRKNIRVPFSEYATNTQMNIISFFKLHLKLTISPWHFHKTIYLGLPYSHWLTSSIINE